MTFPLGIVASQDSGSPAFTPNYVTFDGSSTYLDLGGALSGTPTPADGKTFLFYANLEADTDGVNLNVLLSSDSRVYAFRRSSNTFRVRLRDTAGGTLIQITSSATVAAADGKVNVLVSVDTATNYAEMYFDDTLVASDYVIPANDIDYTSSTDWGLFGSSTGVSKFSGVAGNCYVAINQTKLDIGSTVSAATGEANRRLFYDASGVPTDLSGAPTPIIQFTDVASEWNSGTMDAVATGGDWNMNGSVT